MRALVLTDTGPQLRHDYPIPTPGPGEALIQLRCAGVCATDLELTRGYKGGYRGVLGHEFVGEVAAAPDDPRWVGKRVVGEINIGCGTCNLCRRGLGKHCRDRQSLGIIRRDGAFADFFTLPLANLHVVPDTVDDTAAVFAEPLAAALEIPTQIHLMPETRVLLIGDGRLGLLIAQVLARTGCDLTVMGRHPAKLDLLRRLGVGRTLLAQSAPEVPPVDDLADVVVEATGSPSGFAAARRWVRPGGTVVLKSTFAGEQPPLDLSMLVVDEVTVVGSRCGPFAPALRLLESGQVEVKSLVAATYSLDNGDAALAQAAERGVLKVLIQST